MGGAGAGERGMGMGSGDVGRGIWDGGRGHVPQSAADTEHARSTGQPFAMPDFVGAQFAALRGYWNSLRRGNAEIPFADDFSPAALGKMKAQIALLKVFEKPQRFRFDLVGAHVAQVHGADLKDRFADDISPRAPLNYLAAQCATTVESAAPTLYHHPRNAAPADYKRLMLPLWGDGRVNAILAAFDFRGGSDAT